jgi:A/G-specific adenine glycosylase
MYGPGDPASMGAPEAADVRRRLLAWFDATQRDLPWRRTRDPYRILVAEYLLQRTRVASGVPYYERFLARFPDVGALAAASLDDVLRVWEGLGFYRRARHLHEAARAIVARQGGRVPEDAAALARLPGVGPYTAGAVASVAYGQRVPAIDGNAMRVLARLYRIEEDVARGPGRRILQGIGADLVPAERPGAFNQALMELGATVCTPTSPSCGDCPLEDLCLAHSASLEESLPRRTSARRPPRAAVAFVLLTSGDRVLLIRRPSSGLLGGLWSLPGGEVPGRNGRTALRRLVRAQTGLRIDLGEAIGRVDHVFSHRRWSGPILEGRRRSGRVAPKGRWTTREEALGLPLTSFTRRILAKP